MKIPKGRILCVDDDEDTLKMMTSLLGYEDYEVVQAQTVAEGLALAIAMFFHYIFTGPRRPQPEAGEEEL